MIELFALRADKIERIEHEDNEKTASWIESFGRGTVWIRCAKPAVESLAGISEIVHIPFEEFKESIEENERSKVSVNRHLEVVYTSPAMEDGEVITSSIYIYAYQNLIITIERVQNKVLNDTSLALVDNKRRFLFKKPIGYFIFYILDKINDEYLHFTDRISVKVDLFKNRMLTKQTIEQIYDASITLSYFNQALIANIEALNELRKSYFKLFTQEDRKNFSELYYDALQILDTEKIQRELLSNLFNMHSTISSNEMNYFLKIVALVSLLSTLPIVIASVYGMNIKNLPFAEGPYAAYLILGIIFLSPFMAFVAYKFFEKRQ